MRMQARGLDCLQGAQHLPVLDSINDVYTPEDHVDRRCVVFGLCSALVAAGALNQHGGTPEPPPHSQYMN